MELDVDLSTIGEHGGHDVLISHRSTSGGNHRRHRASFGRGLTTVPRKVHGHKIGGRLIIKYQFLALKNPNPCCCFCFSLAVANSHTFMMTTKMIQTHEQCCAKANFVLNVATLFWYPLPRLFLISFFSFLFLFSFLSFVAERKERTTSGDNIGTQLTTTTTTTMVVVSRSSRHPRRHQSVHNLCVDISIGVCYTLDMKELKRWHRVASLWNHNNCGEKKCLLSLLKSNYVTIIPVYMLGSNHRAII